MYADDMLLFAETREGLQNMLDSLFNYTLKWNLTLNINKTQIVGFLKMEVKCDLMRNGSIMAVR